MDDLLPVEELWKEIPGMETYYEASTLGRIRTKQRALRCVDRAGYEQLRVVAPKVLKPVKTRAGFIQMNPSENALRNGVVSRKVLFVHHLVALTWIGSPLGENQDVKHKNALRDDNRFENLEWVTTEEAKLPKKESSLHRYFKSSIATLPDKPRAVVKERKLNPEEVQEVRALAWNGMSLHALSKRFSVSLDLILEAQRRAPSIDT